MIAGIGMVICEHWLGAQNGCMCSFLLRSSDVVSIIEALPIRTVKVVVDGHREDTVRSTKSHSHVLAIFMSSRSVRRHNGLDTHRWSLH